MDVIEKNDNIILKGTNFKSKPIFASFRYPKLDDLVRHLMVEYGETITNGKLPKKKKEFLLENNEPESHVQVPITLQHYLSPFYLSMLIVLGSDVSDTLFLTSPIAKDVENVFKSSQWSQRDKNYDNLLRCLENNASFIPLTYDCTITELEKGWHKTVHLRKHDTVELYIVSKPLEYFPMLFINCSIDNVRNVYDNITSLLISKGDPRYYCPLWFTWALFRPLLFNVVNDFIEFRRRLPGIDVTEEQFVKLRTIYLHKLRRNMISGCNCRSNRALEPSNEIHYRTSWDSLERQYSNYFFWYMPDIPPLYTSHNCTCDQHIF
ncbi:hypothetical protein C6P45_002756 [Maudiozyma exigua]|uniref:Uncharacterized protein n=1 Tax=Maudiozyma exigua TaxID=34358 RepID=A0A9P7B308_MAUEX|nr:hypothetical protein C6P45_002756 [Kazachstania exigua]